MKKEDELKQKQPIEENLKKQAEEALSQNLGVPEVKIESASNNSDNEKTYTYFDSKVLIISLGVISCRCFAMLSISHRN